MEHFKRAFGARLRRLRLQQAGRQQDLADRVGVQAVTVAAWEAGRCLPCAATLLQLGDALGTSVDQLLRGDPDEHPGQLRISA